jgi:glycosyltransferase involved in cell wall biosynthesis
MTAGENIHITGQPLKLAILSFELPTYACAQIRLLHPLRALRGLVQAAWAAEFNGQRFRINSRLLSEADLIIVQRQFPCAATARWLQQILASGKPVIYDTDDLLTDIPVDNPVHHYTQQNRGLLIEFLAQIAAITVSTEPLAQALMPYNKNVIVLPNLIDLSLWPQNRDESGKEPITVGFTGTPTHGRDLECIEEALFRIAGKHRDKVGFVFMGCINEKMKQLPHLSYYEFNPGYEEYVRMLPRLGIDIAVIPLENIAFNHFKSNIKWLEYSACGIPGVFSDLPPYHHSIRHKETGMLATNAPDSWVESLDSLIRDKTMRAAIVTAARQEILSEYSVQRNAVRYLDAYRSILEQTKNRNQLI